ncbi:MAG: hypothetical protein MUE32_04530 [Bacteroidales bacterium]|nr:hypothetical protein [Bacteroidales bacterium]
MKVAISSTGNNSESRLDKRFGRCAFFVIYDTDTKGTEYLPNPNIELEEDAGQASVKLLSERNVRMIISGEFGINIKSMLDSMKIRMIVLKHPDRTIGEIIEMLKK